MRAVLLEASCPFLSSLNLNYGGGEGRSSKDSWLLLSLQAQRLSITQERTEEGCSFLESLSLSTLGKRVQEYIGLISNGKAPSLVGFITPCCSSRAAAELGA